MLFLVPLSPLLRVLALFIGGVFVFGFAAVYWPLTILVVFAAVLIAISRHMASKERLETARKLGETR